MAMFTNDSDFEKVISVEEEMAAALKRHLGFQHDPTYRYIDFRDHGCNGGRK